MEAAQSLPDLIANAQNAKTYEGQIAELLVLAGGSDVQAADLSEAASAIGLLAVDIFAVFEARMQHHFKRGRFSRKLKALLSGAGQPEFSDRIYQYYLAINVLKYGTDVSYRELLKTQSTLVTVKTVEGCVGTNGLVDVTAPGFFEGLCATILEAYHFLER